MGRLTTESNCSIDYDDSTPSKRQYVFCIDIDGVLATTVPTLQYGEAKPILTTIDLVNQLYEAGHKVILFTARGSATGIDWQEETERQLRSWGVRYHQLLFGKPAADFYIDDKALLPDHLNALVSGLNTAKPDTPVD
jgi:dTDP-glucose 4,6-dehydratase